ncbi:carboxypeptidase regulatory-like domain-containing protein [Phaeodactylibacter luteus]|uniref:Trypsin-like serine protease n=1 Tax=Phaeodactylibacter luteus TaxID=1564516 RepID=A0A5C6RJR6_9BACT|nr:carboxypeptidase regulatory-like domain-containing protein [Phaeodactylibacter luteus]TXB62195.1 hypothetical protein FRY97_15195 [Phaeodactylibacter luteus]
MIPNIPLIYRLLLITITILCNAHFAEAQYSYQQLYEAAKAQAENLPVSTKSLKRPGADAPASLAALPLPLGFGTSQEGQWAQMPRGGRLWSLQLEISGSKATALLLSQARLPNGALLLLAGAESEAPIVLKPKDFNSEGQLFTPFIPGGQVLIMLFEPESAAAPAYLQLQRADIALQQLPMMDFGFGTSLGCHLNAACDTADAYRGLQRSVCRIVMVLEEGTAFCTGTLMNNTAQDRTPYVLSAYHCDEGFTPMYSLWRFEFNYESPGCENPLAEPSADVAFGAELKAARRESDFQLLEITGLVSNGLNLRYSGWDKSSAPPQRAVIFHHPSADIKKVAFSDEPATVHPTILNWAAGPTPPLHHLEVDYTTGTFEVGSSGAALFDENGRVRGQLHGGFNGCEGNTTGYFGRLHLSWDEGAAPAERLADWLDPLGTGADTLNGLEQMPGADTIFFGGRIATPDGQAVPGASVVVTTATFQDTVQTDTAGAYRFEQVPLDGVFQVTASRGGDIQNGLSALDLIEIGRHNLGLAPFDSPYKFLAADANASGSVSVLDQIAIRKAILGIDLVFANRPLWQFVPAAWEFDADAPLGTPLPNVFALGNITNNIGNFDFVAVKTGDVNHSSDP